MIDFDDNDKWGGEDKFHIEQLGNGVFAYNPLGFYSEDDIKEFLKNP